MKIKIGGMKELAQLNRHKLYVGVDGMMKFFEMKNKIAEMANHRGLIKDMNRLSSY